MELVVATRNQGKLREIRALLEGSGITVLGLDAFPDLPEIEEDGATFEANARKKAVTVARATGRLTLADDSGLEVAVLDGRPGVHSARYAGETASDADNNAKLLQTLASVPAENRQGAFCCAMALCNREGECRVFFGKVEGLLLDSPRGEGGFGYDPLFLVREYGRTMAELPMEIKNRISHRGQALRQALEVLRTRV
ncbi:non-canonical purine NTP pyrophosphatase, RdgB/HAM1 family [Desulfuromonas soudanensis]|uniref:dITP/XTP pyrophosphatase n=1 Tax=Desulfuromonas soudanensis TaxID=1603606 RepID=A0A0M4D0F1_9BACT|nr:XTP/dITP diphosphatase [Desulfuromonas soudanensis]ALC15971.1 non-canonical purine NTP pyrophosphatase, RdgB/HAM1 family [Desulfuromonas soudanensis]